MLTFGADRCTALFDATRTRENTTTSVRSDLSYGEEVVRGGREAKPQLEPYAYDMISELKAPGENEGYLLHSAQDSAAFRRRCFEDGEFGLGSSGGGMKEEAMGDEE